MVAPGRSLVVLALVKLLLDLAVDTGDQRSSETVGHFEQSSVEDLELLLSEGEGDGFHVSLPKLEPSAVFHQLQHSTK